jgi:hypothetical protein
VLFLWGAISDERSGLSPVSQVKCTKGLLGSCLRHSFGMPSVPQAFLSFREFTNFCRSHGLIFSGELLSAALNRVSTLASTCRLWFPSHRSWV